MQCLVLHDDPLGYVTLTDLLKPVDQLLGVSSRRLLHLLQL